MKYFNFYLIFNFIIFSCEKRINCNYDLIYKDGLTYLNNDLFTGDCESYYESGIIMNKQTYINGMDNGEWKYYFQNGKLETSAEFTNNKKSGQWRYYYDNGSLRQISYYKDGLKDSIWTRFNPDSTIIWKRKFINDKQVDFQY